MKKTNIHLLYFYFGLLILTDFYILFKEGSVLIKQNFSLT